MIWFIVNLTGAICWFLFMSGVFPPDPWAVKAAFFFLAVNSLLGAVKALVER